MDNSNISDLINNIENGTFADAEQVFNDIMDLKAGEHLDQMRQDMAAGIFNDTPEDNDAEDFDHYEITDEDDEYGDQDEIEDTDEDL